MSKQTINIGTAANAKNGDSLRAAFNKVNQNFTELYTALGLDSGGLNLGAFEFSGSTISTTDSSGIIIDQAVTVSSDLTVGGDIVPSIANGGNLGSLTRPFRSLYVSNNTVFLGGIPVSLDANTNELKINNIPISQTLTYADIPNVPTDITDLTDTGNLLGGNPNWSSITGKPAFATVATSGSYNDLSDRPNLAGTYQFSVAADDSTQRLVSTDEVIKFIGAGGITTSSDAEGNITITGSSASSLVNGANTVSLESDGTLTLPGTGTIRTAFGAMSINAPTGSSNLSIKSSDTTTYMIVGNGSAGITVGSYNWQFSNTGNFTFPDSTIQTTAWTGNFGYLTADKDTIRGTADYQYTFATDGYFTASTSSESPNYFFVTYNATNANIAAGWTVVGGTANTTVSSVTYPVAGYPGVIRVNLTAAASSTSGFYPVTVTSPDRLRVEIQPNPGTSDKFAFTTSGLTLPNNSVVSAGGASGLTLGGNFDVKIVADYTDNNRTWTFSDTGNLTVPGDIHGAPVISGGAFPSQVGRTVNITPADDASDKSFKFRIDQYGETFTRAYLEFPTAEVDKQVAAVFPHTNGKAGYIYTQGNDTNGQGMNDAFNIFYNSGDIKITSMGLLGGLHTWKFGDSGDLTIPGDIQSEEDISIRINLADSTTRIWRFGEDGNLNLAGHLQFPNGAEIRDVNGDLRLRAAPGDVAQLQGLDTSGFVDSAVKAYYDNGGLVTINTNIDAGSPEYVWTFDYVGGLTFPDGTATVGKTITVPEGEDFNITLQHDFSDGAGPLPFSFSVSYDRITLPNGNGKIFTGSTAGNNEWALDAANKNLFFPSGDRIDYNGSVANDGADYGLRLFTYDKPVIVTSGQSESWTFGTNGTLTAPGAIDSNNGAGYRTTIDPDSITAVWNGDTIFTIDKGPQGGSINTQEGKTFSISTNDGDKFWYFGTDGSLVVPGDIKSNGNINIDINLSDSTLHRWQFGEDGVFNIPEKILARSASGLTLAANYSVQIVGDHGDNNRTWTFDGVGGDTTLPNGTVIADDGSDGIEIVMPTTTGAANTFKWRFTDQAFGTSTLSLQAGTLDTNLDDWYFGFNGTKYLGIHGAGQYISWFAGGDFGGRLVFGETAGNNAGDANAIEIKSTDGDVYVTSTESVKITVDAADSSARVWRFDPTGVLSLPEGGDIVDSTGVSVLGGGGSGSVLEEPFESKTSATGVIEHDATTNRLFYHTSISANFTANFTNLGLAANEATSISLVLVQGATARMCTAVQIGGSAQTIVWQGSALAPTGNANRTDVVTFSILCTATDTYTVLGMLTSFGG